MRLRFLDIIGPPAKRWRFLTFDDNADRDDKRLICVRDGTLADHGDELADYNRRGAGVFATINQTEGQGARASTSPAVRALPLDPVRKCKLKPHVGGKSAWFHDEIQTWLDGLQRGKYLSDDATSQEA